MRVPLLSAANLLWVAFAEQNEGVEMFIWNARLRLTNSAI